jgi:hypothetical protein
MGIVIMVSIIACLLVYLVVKFLPTVKADAKKAEADIEEKL